MPSVPRESFEAQVRLAVRLATAGTIHNVGAKPVYESYGPELTELLGEKAYAELAAMVQGSGDLTTVDLLVCPPATLVAQFAAQVAEECRRLLRLLVTAASGQHHGEGKRQNHQVAATERGHGTDSQWGTVPLARARAEE